MVWNIFRGSRKEEANALRDGIQNQIKAIEKFAPRQYKKERQVCYYNYGMLDEYLKPLHDLFSTISRCRDLARTGETTQLLQKLFFDVKGFYDPKQKLTSRQAAQDRGLTRRLRQVLLIFYNKENTSESEISSHLQRLKEIEEEAGQKQMTEL